MAYTTLISAAELAAMISHRDLVILDARFSLDDEQWGKYSYLAGHILGAHQADLAEHMSGEIIEGVTGRRPFPDAEQFVDDIAAYSAIGVSALTINLPGATRSEWVDSVGWLGAEVIANIDS